MACLHVQIKIKTFSVKNIKYYLHWRFSKILDQQQYLKEKLRVKNVLSIRNHYSHSKVASHM